MMTLVTFNRFLVLLTTGLLTGILLGDRVGMTPVRPLLPPGSFVQLQQGIHVLFVPLMPILMILSILGGLMVLVLLRRRLTTAAFSLTVAGTVCIAAAFVLTRLFNVPINEQLMTWQSAMPPENVMALWAPWEQSHSVRTILAVLGFAFHCGAAVIGSRNHQ